MIFDNIFMHIHKRVLII